MTATSKIITYYNLFREISNIIHSCIDVDEVLNLIVWKAAEALEAKGSLLRVLNLETRELELSAAYGLSTAYLLKKVSPTGVNVATDLYGEEKLVVIKDLLNDPRVRYPQELQKEGIQMIVDLPFKFRAHFTGRLRVYFDSQKELDKEEIDFAISLASMCACALDKARLLQEQQKKYDHLALHTEKLSALGRMAAAIAHEINNPLAGVLLYSSNLYKKVPAEGPLKEGLEIIMRETQRCKIIIQELLEFARDKEPKKAIADINQIIATSLSMLENEFRLKHIKIERHLSAEIEKALLDQNQLQQVFVNLLLNAVQAIETTGVITIHTRMNASADNILVEIEDTGGGIPSEQMNKIFEPFFSTKRNGSGLGLSVSYGIVKNHGGRLEVQSTPGKGTRFTIILPLHTKGAYQ